jgi:HEAT repeat protein
VKRKLAHLCFVAALFADFVCAGAAVPRELNAPLAFGTGDIPEPVRQPVNQTSGRTVQLLLEASQSAQGSRRVQLIADLGACKQPQAQQALCLLLRDPSPDVRAQAARSLAELGASSSIDKLKELFSDPDPRVRREAIIASAALGDVNAIQSALADPDAWVNQAACAHSIMPDSIGALCKALESLPMSARVAALESLSIKAAWENWRTIVRYTKGSTSQRYAALRALAAMRVAASASAITPLLRDDSSMVRREAVVALGQTASPVERKQMAMRMLGDPDLTVRFAAAEVLGDNPATDAVPRLLEQLSQGDRPLRDAARNALVAIGPASVPAAAKLLSDSNGQRQEDGSYILGQLRDRDHLQAHIALLSSSNWRVVSQAAKSLDRIGDSSAGPPLAAVVEKFAQLQSEKGPDVEDGFAAIAGSIVSAAHLGYTPLLRNIEPMIAAVDCQPNVRQAGIYAYGLLGNASDSINCNQLLSISQDRLEAVWTRLEAVKALGHLRYQPADNMLASMEGNEGDMQLRWVEHWAHERISGRASPFAAPPLNWSADVSIVDLGDASQEQQFSGTLGFQASFLVGAWVPVHLIFRNGLPHRVNGWATFAVSNAGDSQAATVRVLCDVPAQSAVSLAAYGYFPDKTTAGQGGITTAEWFDDTDRRIARAPIEALPLSKRDGFGAESDGSLDTVILRLTDSAGEIVGLGNGDQDASALAVATSERVGFTVKVQMLRIQDAPRHPAGYASCRIVLLDAAPEQLDTAQRGALLDHLRTGGELLLCGRRADAGSWLAQYEPVLSLGQRETSALRTGIDGSQLRFARPATIVEAVDPASADTVVLVKDSELIHVAYRPLGLGCVAFTSFPVNALDGADERSILLWKKILQLTVSSSRPLTMACAPSLGELVGIPTGPIAVPIAVIAGYVGIVLCSQRFFSGAARPWAYVVTVGAAVVGFASMAAFSAWRAPQRAAHGARITMLDLGSAGGGRQQELIAFAGSEDPAFSFTTDQNATVRPLASSEREDVQIQELPFSIPRAGIHPMEIKRVWSAQRALDSQFRVTATATFGPSGLRVNVDNGLNQTMKRPLLVWGGPWSLPDVSIGASSFAPLGRNAPGDYVNAGALRSDADAVRSTIISNVLSASDRVYAQNPRGPLLLAWIDHSPSMIQTSDNTIMATQALLRAPVIVAASDVGSTVAIDGAFCRMIQGPGAGLPYDAARRQWIARNQPGEWIIGFAPPKEIGALRPTRVTLNADLSAPTQTITLLHGLCDRGKPTANRAGVVLAQWNQPIGAQSASFACGDDDFDANGCVWIRLRVESKSTTPSSWFFRELEMNYVANVVDTRRDQLRTGAMP